MHPPARVLLTNDDGHGTAGLRALRQSLAAAGFAVTTIAPDGDRSGTPVDCIRIGLMAQPFPEFDVVVSGLNHGG